ncbi:MAG: amidohydrolase family protein [Chloroflexota bacterium]
MKLYLINGSVIDCVTDDPAPVAATVVVEGTRIVGVYRADGPPAPPPMEDATVIDLAGRYLMPGLWDAHCHPGGMIPDPNREACFETEAERTLRAVRNTSAALHVGVTALRSAGEANFIDVALRDTYANRQPAGLWKKGYADKRLLGPRMFCAGKGLRITGGHGANGRVQPMYLDPALEVDGADEALKAARYVMKMGVDWVKICITGGIAGVREGMGESQMTFDEIKAVCDAAHNKGLKVGAHTGAAAAARLAVRAGLDVVEHGYELDREVCDMMAERGVYYCPTLSVTHDEEYMRRWEWPEYSLRRALEGAERHRQALKFALEAGVKIINGADLNPIADTAIPEIEWVVRAGMSQAQALIASTRRPAELCGLDDLLGSVEPGKLADLIVVQESPLQNISALRDVRLVIKEGEIVVDRMAA